MPRRETAQQTVPRALWGVLAISVVARVSAALWFGDTVTAAPGVADQLSYHELAHRLSQGHGFTFATGWWPATPAGEPTAHWSYLYVSWLAGLYSVVGAHPLVPRLVQAIVVGLVHPWLIWRVTARLFDGRAALWSAGATAVYGYFVYYAGAVMTEAFYIVSVLWTVDRVLVLTQDRQQRRDWIHLGLAMGTATLFRQAFLLCVPVVLAWLAWRRTGLAALRGGLAALAVIVLMVAPWTLRNYYAFGVFMPLNTNAGFAFFWGNHPVHGDRYQPLLEGNQYGDLIPPELRGLNEAQLDQALLTRGLGFVRDAPLRYLRLCAGRVVEFVKFWPSAESSAASNAVRVLSFGLALPLMLAGLFQGVRRSDAAFLVWLAVGHSAVYLLTWALVRYRLPVDAMLMPFVGLALASLAERRPSHLISDVRPVDA